MEVSVEKPGTPEEIVHIGVKGMKWGVRKVVDTAIGTKTAGRRPSSYKQTTSQKSPMSTKKKVAIGVGVATVAVGVAATAYYLKRNGKLPLSSAAKGGGKVYKSMADVPKIKVSEMRQAQRTVDRERYIKLMMSSKKYAPTLEEATRIANETYSRL